MAAKKTRVCIYPKDVQRITGKSYRQCLRMMHKMRVVLGKRPHDFLTVSEFCEFTGIKREDVEDLL